MAERLFFALVPERALQVQLVQLARDVPVQGRRIVRANLHMTLVFLGAVDNIMRAQVEHAASLLRAAPFTLRLDTIGYWPRSHIAWVGPHNSPPALLALLDRLHEHLQAQCAFTPPERAFHAHITLARDAKPLRGASCQAIDWPVSAFSLLRSQPVARGVRYVLENTWALTGN